MSPWIIFCKSSDMLNISPTVCVLYSPLVCKMVISISTNCVFVTSANLTIFWNYSWMLAMVSIPYMILWYFFIQFFLSLFNVMIRSILLTVHEIYGLEKVGAAVNCWAINIDKNFLLSVELWDVELRFYSPLL